MWTLMLEAASLTMTQLSAPETPCSLSHCLAPLHEVEQAHLSIRLWTALQRHPEASILSPIFTATLPHTWALDTVQVLSPTLHARGHTALLSSCKRPSKASRQCLCVWGVGLGMADLCISSSSASSNHVIPAL